MNSGEFGVVFRFGVGFGMGSFSGLSLTFTRPDSSAFTVSNPSVTLGSGDVVTSLGTFLNQQYVLYTFAQGDISMPGTYQVRLTYTDNAPKQLISTPAFFTIGQ